MDKKDKSTEKIKKRREIWFIVIAVGAAAILYFSGILAPGGKGVYAVIYCDGEEMMRVPLTEEYTEIPVETPFGTNRVVISHGEVCVTEADCPDKLCVKQGKIHNHGQTIVCLPHKLVVEIEGGKAPEYDVVSK